MTRTRQFLFGIVTPDSRGGWQLRRKGKMPMPVPKVTAEDRIGIGRWLLWQLSDSGERIRLVKAQPRPLLRIQPDGAVPTGVEATDDPTGDAFADYVVSLLAADRVRAALIATPNAAKPRRAVDNRIKSTSVRALQGGAVESNRRRH